MSDAPIVERVARAICAARVARVYCLLKAELRAELVGKHWREHIPEARASIQAMREPTDEMVIAGMRAYDTSRDIWAAMIDEALKDTK
jgi:hypothetical protein